MLSLNFSRINRFVTLFTNFYSSPVQFLNYSITSYSAYKFTVVHLFDQNNQNCSGMYEKIRKLFHLFDSTTPDPYYLVQSGFKLYFRYPCYTCFLSHIEPKRQMSARYARKKFTSNYVAIGYGGKKIIWYLLLALDIFSRAYCWLLSWIRNPKASSMIRNMLMVKAEQ